MNDNKVVITGFGMITALGLDVQTNWQNLVDGKSGVKRISLFDASHLETQIAAEVDSSFEEYAEKNISRRNSKKMIRCTKMALMAAQEAISQSGLDFNSFDRWRIPVIMGVLTPGYNDREIAKSDSNIIVRSMPNAPSAWISLLYGLEGPNFNISTACASSSYAIGMGYQMIKNNQADLVIVGGTDSHIDEENIKGFNQILALSARNDSPETASRPFTKSRDGFVMGEGAGIMVLESEKIARQRNATIYGEVGGFCMSSDAFDLVAPRKDGEYMLKNMDRALKDARLNPEDIDYINAHGTSTNLNDKYETMAIKRLFSANGNPLAVSSSKSMIGHTIGSAGILEGIITAKSIHHKIITPTINYHDPDPELDLDYVPNQAREKSIKAALSNSFGFGGHNATVVFKQYN